MKHVILHSFVLICVFSARYAYVSAQPPSLPDIPYNYANQDLPLYFTAELANVPRERPLTDNGATLGRVLFYDKQLSRNNSTACASCHLQERGFADDNRFSLGFEKGETRRNSMALANMQYDPKFFWDERASTLEELALMPIQDSIEMGMDLDDLVAKLQAVPYYPALFESAFGDSEVTSDRIAGALAQFLRSMVSYRSKFDEGMQQTFNFIADFPNFTERENLGKELFIQNCMPCHIGPLTRSAFPSNNGLDGYDNDHGMGEIAENEFETDVFKSPGLRNIELTAPYMHDGRIATLREVIEHYSTGIQPHPQLGFRLIPGGLQFSEEEEKALLAFCETLTDTSFIADERFSNPFKTTTGVSDGHITFASAHVSAAYPNPARQNVSVTIETESAAEIDVRVLDVSGKLVRNFRERRYNAGTHTVHWDGTNDAGGRVRSGVYIVLLTTPERRVERKVTMIR